MRNFFGRAWAVLIVMICGHSWIAAAQQAVSAVPTPPATDARSGASFPVKRAYREDLNSIRLDSSVLVADEPLLGSTYDVPANNFVRELYQVRWRPNDPLDLYVVRPRGVKKPPVVLYLYGYRADTERFKDDGWCSRVTGGGYAAVGFVSALSGHRFHDRPMKEWFVSDMQESLATSTHDVQMILNYLSTRSDLDMDRVGMLGEGSGGAIAILAAAADPRIKAVELLNPWGDWPDWLAKSSVIPEAERGKYLKLEFLADIANLDPLKWLPTLKTAVHLQNVRGVYGMPQECQEKLDAAAPESALVDQYGDPMAFYQEASGGRVFDWIQQQVSATGTSKPGEADSQNHHRFYPALGGNPVKSLSANH